MVDFTLNAKARTDLGKGASRRLRRNADLVPAIVYGGDKAPQNVALEARELKKAWKTKLSTPTSSACPSTARKKTCC